MKEQINLPPHLQKKVDEAAREAEERMEIEYDLRNNPAYKKFFSRFEPDNIEEFIKDYSSRKISWINWGKSFYQQREDQQLQYLLLAELCLWQIQQKKLFNLQCQWRAEKIKLQGVTVTPDFQYWQFHIRHCHFLPPITQWEFELYMDYMQSGESEIDPWECDNRFEWQDYKRITEESKHPEKQDENIFPYWYSYFDSKMGTGSLMDLPDIRGQKEERYIRLYHEHIAKNKPLGISGMVEPWDNKNFLSAWEPKIVEEFIRTYENKQILKYYLFYHERSIKNMDSTDELAQEAFEDLREADEPVSIRSGNDWREALIETWEDYRNKQIVKLLPLVYDEYLQKHNLGITYEKEETPALVEHAEEWKNAIIKGRELAGEPPDLNF